MSTDILSATSILEQKGTPLILKVAVVLGMMSLMGGTITGVMTYMNLGYNESFYQDWLSSFMTAAVSVIPMGFVLMALLTKLSERLLQTVSEGKRNIVVGVFMALIMESGMAFTTALNNIGLEDKTVFLSGWIEGLVGALPVALTLMAIISTTIKPKVERFLAS